jgi:hypothetical protein
MAVKGEKCAAGCTCGRHKRAKCPAGCTCGLHRMTPERLARLRSNANNRLGTKMPEDHRRKISTALTGRPLSEEHRQKLVAINSDPELKRRRAAKRKLLRTAPETHRQMHKRLVIDRGSATGYDCVDCGSPADAWTHDWSTWEDVAQDIGRKRLTFSTNPDAYEPRCHACHNRLDRNPAPWDLPGSRRGARLIEAEVEWIRTCGLKPRFVAAALGIHPATVWGIRTGKTWSDTHRPA